MNAICKLRSFFYEHCKPYMGEWGVGALRVHVHRGAKYAGRYNTVWSVRTQSERVVRWPEKVHPLRVRRVWAGTDGG